MNIINKLTLNHLKQNKRRTLVTIIGIAISVAMITALITMGTSFLDMMERREINSNGYWHVSYENVNKNQIEKIKKDKNTKEFILSRDLGFSALQKSKNKEKPYFFIKEFNNQGFKNYNINIISGRLPKNPDEVVISSHAISEGGLNYKVGDTLNLDIGNRYYEKNKQDGIPLDVNTSFTSDFSKRKEILIPAIKKYYKIVGIVEKPTFERETSAGYSVFSYVDENTAEPNNVNASIVLNKLSKNVFNNVNKFTRENEIKESKINYSLIKWSGIAPERASETLLIGASIIVLAIIILGSVSLIYNAFSISISERSKHLGMLSSVGATRSQKRNSVLFEAGIISLISIPIGIIAGLIGIGTTFIFMAPLINEALEINEKLTLVVNPIGMVLVVIISLIIIYISAYIPAIRASKITPIDAIRQNKDIKLTRKSIKPYKITRRIFGLEGELGLKNIKRNKKRYLITLFSLTISIVLFLTASIFNTYIKRATGVSDYKANYDIEVNLQVEDESKKKDFYNKIIEEGNIDDYSISKHMYLDILLEDSMITTSSKYIDFEQVPKIEGKHRQLAEIISLSKEDFSKYVKEVGGDVEKLKASKDLSGVVIDNAIYYKDEGYVRDKSINVKIGDYIDIAEISGEKSVNKVNRIKVEKLTNRVPLGGDHKHQQASVRIVVSDETLEKIGSGFKDNKQFKRIAAFSSALFIKSKEHLKVEANIEKLQPLSGERAYVENIEKIEKRVNQARLILSVFLYGFVALMTLVSVANIFNTISTSISFRKKELAMLKSVGMTPKEFNKMINYESIFYGIKSLAYGIAMSFLIMVLLYKYLSGGFVFGFEIPWIAIGIATLGIFIIIKISMIYASSKIKKENIIDVLKESDV